MCAEILTCASAHLCRAKFWVPRALHANNYNLVCYELKLTARVPRRISSSACLLCQQFQPGIRWYLLFAEDVYIAIHIFIYQIDWLLLWQNYGAEGIFFCRVLYCHICLSFQIKVLLQSIYRRRHIFDITHTKLGVNELKCKNWCPHFSNTSRFHVQGVVLNLQYFEKSKKNI